MDPLAGRGARRAAPRGGPRRHARTAPGSSASGRRCGGRRRARLPSSPQLGLRARMIAEAALSWTRWVSVISTSSRPAASERLLELAPGQRPGDAAGPLRHVGPGRLVHVLVGDHVGDGEAPAGLQDPRRLGQHPRLVAGEVDHAVGDHDVDRSRREAGSPRSHRAATRRSRRRPCAGSRGPGRASRRSCRARRPCRSDRPAWPRAARRCRRRSRGRARSPRRRARRRRSGCRSRARPSSPCRAARRARPRRRGRRRRPGLPRR